MPGFRRAGGFMPPGLAVILQHAGDRRTLERALGVPLPVPPPAQRFFQAVFGEVVQGRDCLWRAQAAFHQ